MIRPWFLIISITLHCLVHKHICLVSICSLWLSVLVYFSVLVSVKYCQFSFLELRLSYHSIELNSISFEPIKLITILWSILINQFKRYLLPQIHEHTALPLLTIPSLFHMKITASVTKSSHEDCDLCYLHLQIFFLYIHSSSLLENKKLFWSLFSSVN